MIPRPALPGAVLAAVLGIASPLLTAQRPAPAVPTQPGSDVRNELDEVRDLLRTQARLLSEQRRQIERQQAQIDELRGRMGLTPAGADSETWATNGAADLDRQVEEIRGTGASGRGSLSAASAPPASAPHLELAILERPATAAPPIAPPPVLVEPQQGSEGSDRPLSVHFGKASLTPGGWVDLTGYYRSRTVGSGLGTSFATIPYSNTVLGGLSEARLTAASSRITLRADENFSGTRVFGYAEADFNGVLPGNAYVSTNSSSLRLRVFFTDIARGRWEFLGGQSWSLMTPNRVAISPF